MVIAYIILVFLLGLIMGSLLNVIIYRTEKGTGFLWGRSHCPKCKKLIRWYDNIPVISYIILRGKCRHCHKSISWQYPLVELASGLLALIAIRGFIVGDEAGWFMPENWPLYAFMLAITGLLIVVFVYDLKHYLILDKFVFFGVFITLFYIIAVDMKTGFWVDYSLYRDEMSLMSSQVVRGILGALVCGGFFYLMVLLSKERWMGWGDVKFGIFMGLLLGFPQVIPALFIAYFLGALIGLSLIALKRKKMKSEMPFGPFLCIGTYISFLYGNELVYWYLNILN